ncbi:MAG: PDZ domain-containing protein [Planctomycetes bacterium]|nr:PDZ domain-containing protein [Planctomycetota bacterium]
MSLISELWDTQTGTRLETLVDQYAATFSHDGSRVLTCSIDGSLRIFDTTSGDLLETFGGIGSVESVAFSPDGHRIVCAGRDGNVWLFHDDVERARPYWESADVRRRAQPRVDALFAKLTRRSDVIRTLSQDAELDPALRATAIELAREHVEKVFGFTYGPPDEETAKQLGLTATEALVVRSVERGSTAEVGGLRPNDVILRVDDQPASQDALRDAKAERAVGAIVAFTIRRNGETQTLSVRIGAQ